MPGLTVWCTTGRAPLAREGLLAEMTDFSQNECFAKGCGFGLILRKVVVLALFSVRWWFGHCSPQGGGFVLVPVRWWFCPFTRKVVVWPSVPVRWWFRHFREKPHF